jgi:hypothetical protein
MACDDVQLVRRASLLPLLVVLLREHSRALQGDGP